MRVLFGGRETEDTLSRLDVLWDLMFYEMSGLLQADGEGYYDGDELVLEVHEPAPNSAAPDESRR